MKNSLLIVMVSVWLLVTSIGAYAQEEGNGDANVSGPELVWSRTYGEHRVDLVAGIARHPDGGVVVAQTRFNYDPPETTYDPSREEDNFYPGGMILLTKIDSAGNKIWEKSYGDKDRVYRTVSITESDGGFVVAAGIRPYGLLPDGTWIGEGPPAYGPSLPKDPDEWSMLSTYAFKIDGDGRIVWEKIYEDVDMPISLVGDGNGGYLLNGQRIVSWFQSEGWWHQDETYMVGIDENGDKTWEGSYPRPYSPVRELLCTIGTGDGVFVAIMRDGVAFRAFRGMTSTPEIRYQSRNLFTGCSSLAGVDMAASKYGGFIVSHMQYSDPNDEREYPAGVIKVDEEFNTVWNRTVSPPMCAGLFGPYPCRVRPYLVGTGDGGCVAAFAREVYSGMGSNEVRLCRFDAEGNTVWNRTYDDLIRSGSSPAVYWDSEYGCMDLVGSGDGGFVLAGSVLGDLRVLKIDADGGLVWDRIHGSRDVPLDIVESGDGAYIVAGFTQRGSMGRDGYLARIDTDGEMIWEAWYGGPTGDSFEAVVPSRDGGSVAAGYSSSFSGDRDVYIVKIDGEGHKIWEKTYGSTEQDWAEDIVPAHDGGFLVVGNTESYWHDSSYLYVLRIDTRGEKVWEKNFAYGGKDYAHGVAVSGDGYIIAGQTDDPSDPDVGSYLLKIDDSGDVVWERVREYLFEWAESFHGCIVASIVNGKNGGFAVTTYPIDGTIVGQTGGFDEYYLLGIRGLASVSMIDDQGQKMWETPLHQPPWELPWGALTAGTCDGGFILAGLTLSRIDAQGEVVWFRDIAEPSIDLLEADLSSYGSFQSSHWMFPYCMSGGEDGTFVVAGLTEGQFAGMDIILDRIHAGVMHIAKFQDPDLASIKCPEPLILMTLLLLLVPGLLRWARARGT